MSLEEQKKAQKKELKKKKEDERKRQVEEARMEEEERARLEREKMKSRRVKEEDTQPEETPLAVLGPAPRADPYGSWKPVEIRSVDLLCLHSLFVFVFSIHQSRLLQLHAAGYVTLISQNRSGCIETGLSNFAITNTVA